MEEIDKCEKGASPFRRPIYGWGINDANYRVIISEKVDGKTKQLWKCPYYTKWFSMLNRCLSPKYKENKETYTDKVICEEWKYFSNFRMWMVTQDWRGRHLDKDLLVLNNRVYSPETCCFVTLEVNGFMTKRQNDRGAYPIGVSLYKPTPTHHPFIASISKFRVYKKSQSLGRFDCPLLAHKAWQVAKIERAYLLREGYKDEPLTVKGLQRVADKIQYDLDNDLITEDF